MGISSFVEVGCGCAFIARLHLTEKKLSFFSVKTTCISEAKLIRLCIRLAHVLGHVRLSGTLSYTAKDLTS